MFRRSVASLLFALAAGMGLFALAPRSAEAANPGMSVKIVVLEQTPSRVKFKVTGSASLGPVHANINTDPMFVYTSGSSSKTFNLLPGVFLRVTATRTSNKLQVKCDAWTYVLGNKVSASDTKSVSLN